MQNLHIEMLMVCRIVYNGESMFSYLKINFTSVKKEEMWHVMQSNSVSKGLFYFSGHQNLGTHAGGILP